MYGSLSSGRSAGPAHSSIIPIKIMAHPQHDPPCPSPPVRATSTPNYSSPARDPQPPPRSPPSSPRTPLFPSHSLNPGESLQPPLRETTTPSFLFNSSFLPEDGTSTGSPAPGVVVPPGPPLPPCCPVAGGYQPTHPGIFWVNNWPYLVRRLLGRGGFGEVYEVELLLPPNSQVLVDENGDVM